MNQKRKCSKCGLLIDDDLPYCPYCGYQQEKIDEKNDNQKIIDTSESTINTRPKRKSFFKFDSQILSISTLKSVVFFILGFIGLDLSSTLLSIIVKKVNPYFSYTISGSAFTNFSLYLLFFGIFIALLADDIKKVLILFKGPKKIAKGILYGVIIIGISIGLNLIINIISSLFNIQTTSNDNQSSLTTIIKAFPLLSILVFGVVGPIVEEFTYRVGLFTIIRKHNKVLAYVLTAIIFGLIHFDFSCFVSGNGSTIVNELLNLPSYIVAGLYFCFIYDKYGLQGSIIAHCFNNLYSIFNIIFLMILGQI